MSVCVNELERQCQDLERELAARHSKLKSCHLEIQVRASCFYNLDLGDLSNLFLWFVQHLEQELGSCRQALQVETTNHEQEVRALRKEVVLM